MHKDTPNSKNALTLLLCMKIHGYMKMLTQKLLDTTSKWCMKIVGGRSPKKEDCQMESTRKAIRPNYSSDQA